GAERPGRRAGPARGGCVADVRVRGGRRGGPGGARRVDRSDRTCAARPHPRERGTMQSPMVSEVERHLDELAATAARSADELAGSIAEVAELVLHALDSGRTLFFCGNGGSAADAQHLATEYVVRFRRERRPLAAAALTTDTSLLTAASNDLGFEEVFAR